MRYQALATDYDGTIAHDGVVDDTTLDALRRLKAHGAKIILVTGRELTGMIEVFQHHDVFDLMVLENGGQLHDPHAKTTRTLAPAPPGPLVERLREQNIPISVGHSVVATFEPHGQALFDAVRELHLDWHIVMNKEAVMCLPSGVTKATGLKPALEQLGLTMEQAVAIGDAENDLAMLQQSGLAVAVENALDSVKASADWVTAGARGIGATELIDRWLRTGLDDIQRRRPPTPE